MLGSQLVAIRKGTAPGEAFERAEGKESDPALQAKTQALIDLYQLINLQYSNLQSVYQELDEHKPDLNGLKFAVFGLGDSIYDETFNHGGEIMAKKLKDLGATQVGEHGRHDAASTVKPTTQAEEWAGALTAVIDSVSA